MYVPPTLTAGSLTGQASWLNSFQSLRTALCTMNSNIVVKDGGTDGVQYGNFQPLPDVSAYTAVEFSAQISAMNGSHSGTMTIAVLNQGTAQEALALDVSCPGTSPSYALAVRTHFYSATGTITVARLNEFHTFLAKRHIDALELWIDGTLTLSTPIDPLDVMVTPDEVDVLAEHDNGNLRKWESQAFEVDFPS